MTHECLTKAAQTADLLVRDLQEALETATELESLLILDAMKAASELMLRLERMAKATGV